MVIARSGQFPAALVTAACHSGGTSATGTTECPSSSSENTSGQISQQRACPWHLSGSTVTLIRPTLAK